MAADFVLKVDGTWSWSSSGKWKNAWKDLHTIAGKQGLEPLSWELPHLQAADVTIGQLRAGQYPAGGDDDWAEHLEGQIAGWSGAGAPPPPAMPERPALPDAVILEMLEAPPENGVSPLAVNDLPPVGSAGWHSKFGGQEWKYDGDGIYLYLVDREETREPDAEQKAALESSAFARWYSEQKAGADITRELLDNAAA